MDNKAAYLEHRKVVDADSKYWPIYSNSITHFKYILHFDFSMNISLVPKHEVQSAHFSGKQYSLHCATLLNNLSGEFKYIFHLSDDTTHDWSFVDYVMRDILKLFQIPANGNVVLKSDNCSDQYKCLHTFG